MSERKEALEALLANIVAGEWLLRRCDTWLKFHDAFSPHDWSRYHSKGLDAYNGSLDAAKALHDEVLPGCNQYSIITDPTCLKVSVCWWPDGLSSERQIYAEAWGECDNEARAWLQAIIKALIAATDTEVT